MRASFDLVVVGGGLQATLVALAMRGAAPGARVAVVERAARLGGNHTWCFHDTDVSPRMRGWLSPVIAATWSDHELAFPGFERRLTGGYAAISSDRIDAAVRATGATVLTGVSVAAAVPGQVVLTDGRLLTAPWVIDARGPTHQMGSGGFQKFVGLELLGPHDVARPLLMDARVPQRDGYRFVYVLPLAADRLLVEDTYFSDHPDLDDDAIAAEVQSYARQRGWHGEIVRRERGVLPMPWALSPTAPQPGLIVGGYAGGWLHPVTGYSLPPAARLAEAIADGVAADAVLPMVTRAWRRHRAQLGFATRLTRMLFTWYPPDRRRGVLEHFYRLPEDTIARFYALDLTARDRARIFLRRPPPGISWRTAPQPAPTLEAS